MDAPHIQLPDLRLPDTRKPPDPGQHSIGAIDGERSLSFAAVASKSISRQRFPDLQLGNKTYGRKDGVPSISFSQAEYHAATSKFKNTLIAKFQVGRPSLGDIQKFMLQNWNLQGQVTISSIWDDRHVAIILDSENDVMSVLAAPERRIGHTMFRIFRWTPEMSHKKEITTVTKWIRLPGLPLELYDGAILKLITNSFGHFIDTDERTKALTGLQYARACVELDVQNKIPERVRIGLPNEKGFFQDIIVEGGLAYCMKCKKHGHDVTSCRKGKAAGHEAREARDSKMPGKIEMQQQSKMIEKTSPNITGGNLHPDLQQLNVQQLNSNKEIEMERDEMEWNVVLSRNARRRMKKRAKKTEFKYVPRKVSDEPRGESSNEVPEPRGEGSKEVPHNGDVNHMEAIVNGEKHMTSQERHANCTLSVETAPSGPAREDVRTEHVGPTIGKACGSSKEGQPFMPQRVTTMSVQEVADLAKAHVKGARKELDLNSRSEEEDSRGEDNVPSGPGGNCNVDGGEHHLSPILHV